MRGFLTAFARNTVFANILLALIFLAGGLALFNMVRETLPETAMDSLSVMVPWPGADPEEVEEAICRKIEEAVEGIEGIKHCITHSRESVGMAYIQVVEGYDIDYVKEELKKAVDAISTFPVDAERPITRQSRLRVPVVFLGLYGEALTERELKEWSEDILDDLRALPEVTQVHSFGARDYEIAIEVSEERLREYGITFAQVAQAVRGSSLNLSGGTMRTEGEEIRLRVMGRKYTAKELANVVVLARPGGDIITLDRITHIRDGFTEDRSIARLNGKPAMLCVVEKTPDEDTLAIDKAVRSYVEEKNKLLPEGVDMGVWGDIAGELRARIRLLVRNGFIGLGLVFVLLWLFLDIRLSFWAGMGMPISVMGAFGIMYAVGATINMISLFGLIMVLGIIVDDAIVVGEAIYVARKRGAPPLQAAVDGVFEVGMPVVAAVITTIVAFMPLFFVGGVMGKLIYIVPVVVISCLAISLVECLVLLPAHLNHLPDLNSKTLAGNPVRRAVQRFHNRTNAFPEWFVDRIYRPMIARILEWRYVSLGVAIMVVLATWGIWDGHFLKFQFFPKMDGNNMVASVEFPNGTPLVVTEKAVALIEDAIHRVAGKTQTKSRKPLVVNTFSLAGSKGSHGGWVRVQLLESADRGIHSEDLMAAWEDECGVISGAVSLSISADELTPGGAPIEVWVQGPDMDEILAVSDKLMEKLGTYDGVYQIQNDFRPGKNEIKLRLKPEARTLGLTVADLARQIRGGYFGEQAIRLQRGRDDVRVRVRYPLEERNRLAEFERMRIRTPLGHEVPLRSMATIAFEPGYASIKRVDGLRRVRVTAEVSSARANANEILTELRAGFFGELRSAHPAVRLELEGEQRSMNESFGSLLVGYPLAMLGVFIIIATLFRSYIQPIVIMITVPFGIVGAILGHLLLGYDLSIMSLFGMVAVSGVVVNDAIVLIECVNSHVANGEPFYEAVCTGAARRFRAIFLTTVSTVGGLTPLILERDLQARFLIPMGISLAAGVAFATLLTLFLIPCLLCVLNDVRRLLVRMVTGYWPSPEDVEPARLRALGAAADTAG